MEKNIRGCVVKYNNVHYIVTKHRGTKVNLCLLNDGKVVHRDIDVAELRVSGGNKERKIKGFRS